MTADEIKNKLQAPFAAEDIEWKPQTSGMTGDRSYVMAAPYVTNRAIQKRLDDVFGVFGWENAYRPSPCGKGFLCGITVHFDNIKVTKWDGSENTHIEPLKGALSGSMKRAAVQFGIGRYLYDLPEFWAKSVPCGTKSRHEYGNVINNKRKNIPNIAWENPLLPDWALPVFDFKPYSTAIVNAKNIHELKDAFASAYNVARINQNKDQRDLFKIEYDDKCKEFEALAAQNVAEDTQVISAWVTKQSKNYDLVPELTAVVAIHKNQLQALKRKCDGTFVDTDKFIKQLDAAFKKRSKKLNEEGQHDNTSNN